MNWMGFTESWFKQFRDAPDWEDKKKVYLERLEYELSMIIKTGFSGYFLIVGDFINWAKKNGISVGPGRGSGAGSIVAYSLRITDVDPIHYGLLFERFINLDRISMPDFDVDFCQERRGEVIGYVSEKYGKDKVCQIVSYGAMSAKSVIKDVSRVFNISFKEANEISALIPSKPGMSLTEAFQLEPELGKLEKSDARFKQIFICLKIFRIGPEANSGSSISFSDRANNVQPGFFFTTRKGHSVFRAITPHPYFKIL